MQVIAAFQRGRDAAPGMRVGEHFELMADPEEIFVLQIQLGQWIAPVRIESGRDQDKVRGESIDRIEQPGLPGVRNSSLPEPGGSPALKMLEATFRCGSP